MQCCLNLFPIFALLKPVCYEYFKNEYARKNMGKRYSR